MQERVSSSAMEPAAPAALRYSRGQISNIAESVATQLDYHPGDSLEDLVSKIGGRIAYVNNWDGVNGSSGSIEVRNGSFEIRLPSDTGPLRNRFTIAHELGHYVLHYLYPNQKLGGSINWLVADRYGVGDVEREANWFAAAFLMPSVEYRAAYEKYKGEHVVIANQFRVSVQASEVRAKVLNLES